jgi:hypothetical protein
VKRFTVIVGVIFVVAAALWGPGWAETHPTAAAVLAVAAGFVVLGLFLFAGVVIGGVWTTRTMRAGADIALKAQEVNDEWDAKKTAAFAGLMREGASVARQLPGALPALPMPGQVPGQAGLADGTMFLPPLAEFSPTYRNYQVIDQEGKEPYENAE